MSLNIFIRMELNFHKINSFFSSINLIIIVGNTHQSRAQGFIYIAYSTG